MSTADENRVHNGVTSKIKAICRITPFTAFSEVMFSFWICSCLFDWSITQRKFGISSITFAALLMHIIPHSRVGSYLPDVSAQHFHKFSPRGDHWLPSLSFKHLIACVGRSKPAVVVSLSCYAFFHSQPLDNFTVAHVRSGCCEHMLKCLVSS